MTLFAIPLYPTISAVHLLLERSGGRISEILGIKWSDMIAPGVFVIKGSKKSRSYTIHFPEYDQKEWQLCRSSEKIFGPLNRTTVWRVFKSAGIFYTPPGNKNRAVTHSLRHKFAKSVQQVYNDPKVIQDSMRHNSIKSQSHYLKKK